MALPSASRRPEARGSDARLARVDTPDAGAREPSAAPEVGEAATPGEPTPSNRTTRTTQTTVPLADLLERLELSLMRRGVTMHWASDVAQARRLVGAILAGNRAGRVATSSSPLVRAVAGDGLGGPEVASLATADLMPSGGGGGVARADELSERVRAEVLRRAAHCDSAVVGVTAAAADTGTLVTVERDLEATVALHSPSTVVALLAPDSVLASSSDVTAALGPLLTGPRPPSVVSWCGVGADRPRQMAVVLVADPGLTVEAGSSAARRWRVELDEPRLGGPSDA